MADKIRLLPEVVANQIAAGEVVDDPSSVVKEMMENALDAGAQSVKVNIREGGRELIQIVDDGCGMSPIDARMAFDRHATSKIRSAEDIYALQTFGFRGEALASIAAVAQVELRTRQAEDETGTLTEINGGQFVGQQPVMCPRGSQFVVRNLFYNVPARRRFMKKTTVLRSQIKAEFQHVALCNPQIAFELYDNDAPLLLLPQATLAGRIVDVVGRHIKQNLLEVDADTSIASIGGYIGRPAAAKRRNAEQYLFVNGRFFRSPYLQSAIMKAYEKLIPESSQPSFFLYLTIDPSRIDVNVSPHKTEVKFADEEAVWQIVNAAVRETLAKTGAVPMMDFDREESVEIPVMERGAVYGEPMAMSNSAYNPFNETYVDPSAPDPNVDFAGFDMPGEGQMVADASGVDADCGFGAIDFIDDFEHADFGTGSAGAAGRARSVMPSGGASRSGTSLRDFAPGGGSEEFEEFESTTGTGFSAGSPGCGSELEFIPSEGEQQQLAIDLDPAFGDLLCVGGGMVVALYAGRPVVVDLRRARERVAYDDCMQVLGSGCAASQQLLFPERLTLSAAEYALLEEHAVELAAVGFDLDLAGDGVVEVKGTPADLGGEAVDKLLYELLQTFALPLSVERVHRERIAAVMARNSARAGRCEPGREEAAALLERLARSTDPSFTPSGKPILAELSREDLRARLG